MDGPLVHHMLMRVQNGDTDAAGVLYAHVAEELTGIAKSSKYQLSEDEALDAMSKMIENVLKSCQTYNPECMNQATGWVWRIFSNAVHDILREKKRRAENEQFTISLDRLDEEDITKIEMLRPRRERLQPSPVQAEAIDAVPKNLDELIEETGNAFVKDMDFWNPENRYLRLETREAVQQTLRNSGPDVRELLTRWPKRGPLSEELRKAMQRIHDRFKEIYPGD